MRLAVQSAFRLALQDDAVGERGRRSEASLRTDDPPSGHERSASIDLAAHAVTALTDGFLFQILEENVGVVRTTEGRLAYLTALVDLTLAGISPSLQQ
jgi:hypothetical protein